MEMIHFNPQQGGQQPQYSVPAILSKVTAPEQRAFIEANTLEMSLDEVRSRHIVPVFRCGEPLISQAAFVDTAYEVVREVYRAERVNDPVLRVSHLVKGRIPEALGKKASELKEWEQTICYSRLGFIIEVPTITDEVGAQTLSLVIGGVRGYDQDHIGSKKGVDEHFKLVIGFAVRVCTNLCISTDGLVSDMKVRSLEELRKSIFQLVKDFDPIQSVRTIDRFTNYCLTERQFAQFLGKAKLHQHLPANQKSALYDFPFGEAQINKVVREYYTSEHFGREQDGSISLWNLYQNLTEANKSSYLDTYLDRAAAATSFVGELAYSLERGTRNWFLS